MVESRCGLRCSECERKEEVKCKGCISMDKPFWGGDCLVKSCCEEKENDHCGQCLEFPCQKLSDMGKEEGFDSAEKIAQCEEWAEEEAELNMATMMMLGVF